MGLLSGFEKFGVTEEASKDLYAKPVTAKEEKEAAEAKPTVNVPKEEDFLLDKTLRCTVCDQVFKAKLVKSARVRRLEPDFDLRPNHEHIDTVKYGIVSCPHCGYTALNRTFQHLSPGQIKLIKENIAKNFRPKSGDEPATYSYLEAIERHKFALANAVVKRAHASEIANIALNIAWLERTYIPMMPVTTDFEKQEKEEMIAEQREAYEQAYEGFMKAIGEESYPIAGMDQSTLDYLIANLAFELGHIEVASRMISGLLGSRTTSAKVKDRAYDMKQQIIAQIKQGKQ